MNILVKIKANFFLFLVFIAYITLFVFYPSIGTASLSNSVYYIKEMISIMPVIFVLTALLDTWVPKDKIIKYLGKESKAKGAILSLVLGSISAGPIYAAFPLCVMLHKKGASIRNFVIILSAWAVIKVPMLLNEMKFLGVKFMIIRWVLTVISILVFSWIASKIIKDDDLPKSTDTSEAALNREPIRINQTACIGCSLCVKNYPELFELKNKKATIKKIETEIDSNRLEDVLSICPVHAITVSKSDDN